jgi:hypothetical protein
MGGETCAAEHRPHYGCRSCCGYTPCLERHGRCSAVVRRVHGRIRPVATDQHRSGRTGANCLKRKLRGPLGTAGRPLRATSSLGLYRLSKVVVLLPTCRIWLCRYAAVEPGRQCIKVPRFRVPFGWACLALPPSMLLLHRIRLMWVAIP